MRTGRGIAGLVAAAVWWAAPWVDTAARADATPGVTAAADATATPGNGKISLDDYLAGVSKPGLTDAKKKEFAAKYAGQKVSWTGYVRAVSRNKSRDGDTFLVILKSKPETDPPPGVFIASFDASSEKSVTALQENQKVTISGTLAVRQNPNAPVLMSAELKE